MKNLFAAASSLAAAALPAPVAAQELPVGQGAADFTVWVEANPGRRGQMLSFEAWEQAAGVQNVLPTWQIVRTASMWRECGGAPFEFPPFQLWPGLTRTLAFIRDHVKVAVGEVEAVSGYRNPALNACAHGAPGSAHQGYFALDLVPLHPLDRHELFRRLCSMHTRFGQASGVGLGFYAYQRFHIDTRSFRRWGAAGPNHNESPCALLERGEDPEPPVVATPALPASATVPNSPAPEGTENPPQ
jgi:hypothetical protein